MPKATGKSRKTGSRPAASSRAERSPSAPASSLLDPVRLAVDLPLALWVLLIGGLYASTQLFDALALAAAAMGR